MNESNGRLKKRLQRILLMLPYVIQNPGVTVDELAARFGARRHELIDDIELVFLCGLPGYGPGDLIDASIEDNRVYVDAADYFSAPFRISPAEALALYSGGQALAALPGMEGADALRRALVKLSRALRVDDGIEADAGIEVKMGADPSAHLDTLRRALEDKRKVALSYFSASSGRVMERTAAPWGLFTALGHWYLIAWDDSSDDERMFRVDRIKEVEIHEAPAQVPPDFDPERYRGAFLGRGEIEMTMEISPEAGRWFADYYPLTAAKELDDGWWSVALVAGGLRWAAIQVIKLGEEVRAVTPGSVMDEARGLAGAIARRYD